MYSTQFEGKFVVAGRFIRTLKDKIYKYVTSKSKNVHIDKLDDMVNKCNNTYHRTIKMKPIDLKSKTYINSSKETNDIDPKFKIDDVVRMPKYKSIFANVFTPNWPEESVVIKKVKSTIPCTYITNDLFEEEINTAFYKKELQNTNQKEFN